MAIVEIPLTQGQVAIVDESDWALVRQFKWCASRPKSSKTFYATSWIGGRTVLMHRLILGVSNPRQKIDHKDGSGLNNTRDNLRLATDAENVRNRKKWCGKSRFLGVLKRCDVKSRPWRAQIQVNRKLLNIGHFSTEVDAALAYDRAAKQHFGEFACLNFPVE